MSKNENKKKIGELGEGFVLYKDHFQYILEKGGHESFYSSLDGVLWNLIQQHKLLHIESIATLDAFENRQKKYIAEVMNQFRSLEKKLALDVKAVKDIE